MWGFTINCSTYSWIHKAKKCTEWCDVIKIPFSTSDLSVTGFVWAERRFSSVQSILLDSNKMCEHTSHATPAETQALLRLRHNVLMWQILPPLVGLSSPILSCWRFLDWGLSVCADGLQMNFCNSGFPLDLSCRSHCSHLPTVNEVVWVATMLL